MRGAVLAKLVAVLVSAGVVTAVAGLVTLARDTAVEGGGPQVAAQLGTAFEDMVAGTLTPVAAQTVAQAVTQTAAQSVAQPVVRPVAQAVSAAAPALPPPTTPPAPVPAAAAAIAVSPSPAAAPGAPTSAALAPPPAVIEARPAESDAPIRSLRPKPKDAELAAAMAAQRQQKARAAPPPPRGNATRDAAKGTAQGSQKQAAAARSGTARPSATQPGNAAASAYPGKVMQRISRQSRPRVRAKGTAVIAFSISPGGGLAGVSVARSSGSDALDRAAVAMIRKAAPFPRPPAGARRQFSINIQGR